MTAAVVRVEAAGQQPDVTRGAGADLVRLVPRGAVAVALVQRPEAEAVPPAQPRAGEGPVVGLEDLVRGRRHRPGVAEDDPEQVRLRLDPGVEAALAAGGPGVEAAHRPAAVKELDRAV